MTHSRFAKAINGFHDMKSAEHRFVPDNVHPNPFARDRLLLNDFKARKRAVGYVSLLVSVSIKTTFFQVPGSGFHFLTLKSSYFLG